MYARWRKLKEFFLYPAYELFRQLSITATEQGRCLYISMSQQGRSPFLDVADAVRDFYNRYPYPRPINDLEHYRLQWQDPNRRRADYYLSWPGKSYSENFSILIAGCGTS